MSEVTYDGQSFSIDGRRVWLVSGSVQYTQVPRGLWRSRLRAAKQAGLNCIETAVYWGGHEREPGVFDFEGENDLRAFIEMIAEEGLYCILRPGPYIGGEWDFGGLPAYLHGVKGKKGQWLRYRENEPLFMEAVDRHLRAVFGQVGDLQISQPGGGPIVLVQVEHQWHSGNPEGGSAYFDRLVSMLRQQGCGVPLINNNNLWQDAEGTIDAWHGDEDLPVMMRQLALVKPDAPPMAISMPCASFDSCGASQADPFDAATLEYRLAGLIGAGAQFNLDPFHAGTHLGFNSGRLVEATSAYPAAKAASGTPLDEAGHRGSHYAAAKRLCTFASQFGHVLAASDNVPTPSIALNETNHPIAMLHRSGSQGEVTMLLKSAKDKTTHTPLMLPDGLTLDVPHAGQRAAWVLRNASLAGAATLDYTSLSPWAVLGRSLLVVFGPAGSEGVVSIDGQHHIVKVPTGKTPLIIEGDPVQLVVLSREQLDAAYPCDDGLYVGCDGMDADNRPIPKKGWATLTKIGLDGHANSKRMASPSKPAAPKLSGWQALSISSLVDGSDAAFQPIEGATPLGALGQPMGYGWYRFTQNKPLSGDAMLHAGGDRLHVYQQGKLSALLGKGSGASDGPTPMTLKGDAVVLADALGRFSGGQELGQDPKGLVDNLHFVKAIKLDKPAQTKQPSSDPFTLGAFIAHQQAGVRPMSEAYTWMVKPESRKPVILEIHGLADACIVSVNEQPIRYFGGSLSGGTLRLLLDPAAQGPMTGGKNSIKLEMLAPLPNNTVIDKHIRFYQTTGKTTPREGYAFAPWTIPAADDKGWRAVPKALPSMPGWLKCSFEIGSTDVPLYLEPTGMSKGQVILNGHNVCRYWQQTREGKAVGPQEAYYLPEPWLHTARPNHLLLFDEHSRTPGKVKLCYR